MSDRVATNRSLIIRQRNDSRSKRVAWATFVLNQADNVGLTVDMHVLINVQTDDNAEQIWKEFLGWFPATVIYRSPQQNDHSMIRTEPHINTHHQPDS